MALGFKFSKKFFKGFERIEQGKKDVHKVLRKLRPQWKKDLKQHADFERSPEGKWPRRSAVAQGRAAKRSTLVKRGSTRKATKRRGARSAVSFVPRKKLLGSAPSAVKVSHSKNQGALIAKSTIRNKKGRKFGGVLHFGGRVNNNAVIPPRPFVFVSPKFLDMAVAKLADHVFGGWEND